MGFSEKYQMMLALQRRMLALVLNAMCVGARAKFFFVQLSRRPGALAQARALRAWRGTATT
jgi:hypothetical protein